MFVILERSVSKEKPPPSFVYMTVSLDKETLNVKLSVLENGANLNGVLGKLHLLFNSYEKKKKHENNWEFIFKRVSPQVYLFMTVIKIQWHHLTQLGLFIHSYKNSSLPSRFFLYFRHNNQVDIYNAVHSTLLSTERKSGTLTRFEMLWDCHGKQCVGNRVTSVSVTNKN